MKRKFTIHSVFLLFFMLLALQTQSYAQVGTAVDDSAVTAKIKSKIVLDKNLSIYKVNVSTNNGVVSLSGDVDSDEEASQFIQIAESTDGVKDVDASKMVVKRSTQPLSDVVITGKIKGLFLQEKLFGEREVAVMSIHVETNNGRVYLSGTADSQLQANNAFAIAKSVQGVKDVKSTIKVQTR